MADYSTYKVPDLKKILQERGLVISGNKADLIARLQEDDSKKGGSGAAGEDEIDWDEDDKPTTEPAAAAVAAGGLGQVSNPTAVPNQKVDIDPATTSDLKATQPDSEPKATEATTTTTTTAAEGEAAAKAEEPKPDFSIGLKESDALTEAEKRAARAKRFGIPENEEAKKLAERAKKFGLVEKDSVVKGLDSALPERKAKRGRGERDGGEGRAAKRQTPDRRTGPKGKGVEKGKGGEKREGKKEGGGAAGGGAGKIADDPVEKAKMEARAKKFGKPLAT